MRDLTRTIEELQAQLKKHRRSGLKELPTRTIFIDPLLHALGWDVRDPDCVELEYPTIDGKAVDYALKINKKPVVLLEAKALDDGLEDIKAITQVVGYASNDGIEWCVLTNGHRYRVYNSSQKASAPEKLLFEVSLDPDLPGRLSVDHVANHLVRLSRDSMAKGILDALGDEIFTTAKVRKALDHLFLAPDASFTRLIRKAIGDPGISPSQIKESLPRIWQGQTGVPEPRRPHPPRRSHGAKPRGKRSAVDYGEAHHTAGKPAETVELYRALDRMCHNLSPGRVIRRHLAKYISWSLDSNLFCCVHLLQSGLKVWLKLHPSALSASTPFARDVSRIGHWGVGDIELAIQNASVLRQAQPLIEASFSRATEHSDT